MRESKTPRTDDLIGNVLGRRVALDPEYRREQRIIELCRQLEAELSRYREAEKALPEEPIKGDYVLATKWSDGDPGDAWGVGFYDRREGDRHFVLDAAGQQIRGNGYRRVAKIHPMLGTVLLNSADILEQQPPGGVNLWEMLCAYESALRAHAAAVTAERDAMRERIRILTEETT